MLSKLDELPSRLQQMPRLESLMRVMQEHTAPAALELLTEANLEWLKTLPLSLDRETMTLLHASPGDLVADMAEGTSGRPSLFPHEIGVGGHENSTTAATKIPTDGHLISLKSPKDALSLGHHNMGTGPIV